MAVLHLKLAIFALVYAIKGSVNTLRLMLMCLDPTDVWLLMDLHQSTSVAKTLDLAFLSKRHLVKIFICPVEIFITCFMMELGVGLCLLIIGK